MVGTKLFVFGGQVDGKVINDMWTLDLSRRTFIFCCSEPFCPNIRAVKSQPVWESYEPTHGYEKPLPRAALVSVTTEEHIIMFVSLTFPLYPRYKFL